MRRHRKTTSGELEESMKRGGTKGGLQREMILLELLNMMVIIVLKRSDYGVLKRGMSKDRSGSSY
jgi:hypothetical protein